MTANPLRLIDTSPDGAHISDQIFLLADVIDAGPPLNSCAQIKCERAGIVMRFTYMADFDAWVDHLGLGFRKKTQHVGDMQIVTARGPITCGRHTAELSLRCVILPETGGAA